MTRKHHLLRALCAVAALAATVVQADPEQVVNIYSARQEALIKPLLDRFSAETGIRARLVTAKAGPLLERLRSEGRNSPADLFITTDAGRLHQAQAAGLLQAVRSEALAAAVPAAYREPAGHWYGLSLRARPIMYAKDRVNPNQLGDYESLGDSRWRGRICIRSSSNIYNQSLVASMIAANGEAATLTWLEGLVKNFARRPAGGDRDQIRAVAAGECDLAVANTYYLAQMQRKDPNHADREAADKIAVFWPNQAGRGAHVNISGAGVTRFAAHRDNAVRLLEFLVTQESQRWYAEVNNEYPVAPGVAWSDAVERMGRFKPDALNLAVLGDNNASAVKLMDQAGWQ